MRACFSCRTIPYLPRATSTFVKLRATSSPFIRHQRDLRANNTPGFRQPRFYSTNSHPVSHASSFWTLSISVLLLAGGLTLRNLYQQDCEPKISNVKLLQDQESIFLHTMSEQKPTGHVGNLTEAEEVKLKELWTVLLKVFGIIKDEQADLEKRGTNTSNGAVKPKKKTGFFSWRSEPVNDEPSNDSALAALGPDFKLSESDDKFGQTKEFYDALAQQSPEELRVTFFNMVKHDHPDSLMLRFLRARKWDVNNALVMLISAIRWRSKVMKVDDDIMMNGDGGIPENIKNNNAKLKKEDEDFKNLLKLGESFIHGIDKAGRPICYIRVRLHKIGAHSEASLERYTVYLIETSRLLLQRPVETAALVFDMTDFSLANMDYTPIKFMIKCFEANYPESLGVILIHKAPWIFASIWTIIKGWLDPVVAAKVNFTKSLDELDQFISRDQTLKELGGEDEYEYKYIEPVAGENVKQEDTESRDGLLAKRLQIATDFQNATVTWASNSGNDKAASSSKTRQELATDLQINYWRLDPFVRAKSLYDRLDEVPYPKSKPASVASVSGKRSSEVITTKPIAPDSEIAVVA